MNSKASNPPEELHTRSLRKLFGAEIRLFYRIRLLTQREAAGPEEAAAGPGTGGWTAG
jgi:hypothetical protein